MPDLEPRFEAVRKALERWTAPDDAQEELRNSYLAFLAEHGAEALRRHGGAEHLTASTFIVSADHQHVLLAFHRKAQLWLQMGGHIEDDDAAVADAAAREAREESGLAEVTLWPGGIAELDRHVLVGSFGRCHAHWDLGFVAIASPDEAIVVSDESEQVAWWPIAELPADSPPDLPRRLAHVIAALAS